MTTHTPGKWTTERASVPTDGEYDWAVLADVNGGVKVIAEAFGRVATDARLDAEANARLISAAPELYAYALAVEQWEADLIMDSEAWETGNPAIPQHLWDRWMELQALRLAATAKVRGKAG